MKRTLSTPSLKNEVDKVEINSKPTLRRSHSSTSLKQGRDSVEHDLFFNNKRKSHYESELAQLFLGHVEPFMSVINRVSALILPDIVKILSDIQSSKQSSISYKMHEHLIKDFDLKLVFHLADDNYLKFYQDMIGSLQSKNSENFYKHMYVQFAYITFFTQGTSAKPELDQAVSEHWCTHLDLKKLMSDMNDFRNPSELFKNYMRFKRNFIPGKETKDIGILPPSETKLTLKNQIESHQAGKLLFFMASLPGSFTATGMHDYDLPQVCGPSTTTAKRLALTNQAYLSEEDMQLMHFAISLYNVAIGAHTLDECFMIASKKKFNHYIRGDYTSIVPSIIKERPEFRSFYEAILRLNEEYSDILVSKNAQSTSIESKHSP